MELILFSSDRCSVCFPLKEKLRELSKELSVEFKEVKIEERPQEAAKRLIFSAPTVVLEKEGRELARWSGVFSLEQVRERVERLKDAT